MLGNFTHAKILLQGFSNDNHEMILDYHSLEKLCDELIEYCKFIIDKSGANEINPRKTSEQSKYDSNQWMAIHEWVSNAINL